MAAGDLAEILKLPLTPDGKIDVTALNTLLREMQERLFALEGRTQSSQIRDDLEVLGDVTATGLTTSSLAMPPAGSMAITEVSVDGPLLSDTLGVLPYALPFLDNIGVERDLFFPSPFAVLVREEFLGRGTTTGVIGELGWGLTTGTVGTVNGLSGHMGVIQLDSGVGTVAPIFLSTTMPPDVRYLACVAGLNAGTGGGSTVRFGLLRTTSTAGAGSRGMYFYFSDVNGTWHTVTRDSVSITETNTTVAATAGEFQLLEIVLTTTTVDFYINRRRTNRHTTNLETGVCSPAIVAENTAGANTLLDIDTFAMVGALGQAPKWD